jgi:hypothetical protein
MVKPLMVLKLGNIKKSEREKEKKKGKRTEEQLKLGEKDGVDLLFLPCLLHEAN